MLSIKCTYFYFEFVFGSVFFSNTRKHYNNEKLHKVSDDKIDHSRNSDMEFTSQDIIP